MRLILGSASPHRQELLRQAGYRFEVMPATIDEESITDIDPHRLVLTLAQAKFVAIRSQLTEPAMMITSDLVVAFHNEIRGKPRDESEARRFLASYRNDTMQAICGLLVTNTGTGHQASGVTVATVEFTDIPEAVIDELIDRGNVLHAAGALMTQSPIMRPFIRRFEGSIETCLGLPMELTKQLIDQVSA